jgi:hypothetical protein
VDIDDRIELTSRVATSGRRRGTSPESNRKLRRSTRISE